MKAILCMEKWLAIKDSKAVIPDEETEEREKIIRSSSKGLNFNFPLYNIVLST